MGLGGGLDRCPTAPVGRASPATVASLRLPSFGLDRTDDEVVPRLFTLFLSPPHSLYIFPVCRADRHTADRVPSTSQHAKQTARNFLLSFNSTIGYFFQIFIANVIVIFFNEIVVIMIIIIIV